MPGLINIGATAPKEDAADKKAGSAPAGINRSRRRKSLRNIHYNANKSKTPGERTPRRGSAPAISVPAPPVKAEESLAAADGEQEDALIGGGFGADDSVADSTADDLDGFGKRAQLIPATPHHGTCVLGFRKNIYSTRHTKEELLLLFFNF